MSTPVAGPAPDLKNHLSFDHFLKLRPVLDAGFHSPNFRLTKEACLDAPLIAFLKALKAVGRMLPISGSVGHSTRLLTAWNALATGSPELRKDDVELYWVILGDLFADVFLSALSLQETLAQADPALGSDEALYEKLMEVMTKGDFERPFVSVESQHCSITGKRLAVRVHNWAITLGELDHTSSPSTFKPIEDVVRPALQEARVTFESGELLIADWFRIPEFSKIVDDGLDDVDLNSEAGRNQQTLRYANSSNFVSVCVGNTSPDVLLRSRRDPAAVYVGHASQSASLRKLEAMWDAESFEAVGSVCTDLWWVTIIDRAQLIKLLAPQLGEEAAKAAVTTYIGLHAADIIREKVPPGTYTVRFAGHHSQFQKALDEANQPDQPSGFEAFFMLQQVPAP